ncbi:MAG: DUF4089 domain-containing protein [Hydrogenophaga sp.]|jgi:hypothetical protein|uniref:DUF4089 domain-containing protein n=1 Tax=Hydrogenophaga luteola TaxID=1591122 RepID=A0ABV7WBF7_9BURK|nr:DUF4089 domain-containing protein [Hydrogenophaga sp.]MDD3785558.1 DUF4089 domain-containing protein [Hydrogenophaga sp.]
MTDEQTLAYVKAVAVVVGLPLDEAQIARVAVHLQRTAGLAATLEDIPLTPHDEPAELFCPAPFDSPR